MNGKEITVVVMMFVITLATFGYVMYNFYTGVKYHESISIEVLNVIIDKPRALLTIYVKDSNVPLNEISIDVYYNDKKQSINLGTLTMYINETHLILSNIGSAIVSAICNEYELFARIEPDRNLNLYIIMEKSFTLHKINLNETRVSKKSPCKVRDNNILLYGKTSSVWCLLLALLEGKNLQLELSKTYTVSKSCLFKIIHKPIIIVLIPRNSIVSNSIRSNSLITIGIIYPLTCNSGKASLIVKGKEIYSIEVYGESYGS